MEFEGALQAATYWSESYFPLRQSLDPRNAVNHTIVMTTMNNKTVSNESSALLCPVCKEGNAVPFRQYQFHKIVVWFGAALLTFAIFVGVFFIWGFSWGLSRQEDDESRARTKAHTDFLKKETDFLRKDEAKSSLTKLAGLTEAGISEFEATDTLSTQTLLSLESHERIVAGSVLAGYHQYVNNPKNPHDTGIWTGIAMMGAFLFPPLMFIFLGRLLISRRTVFTCDQCGTGFVLIAENKERPGSRMRYF